MRLLTIQTQEVLDVLNRDGIYTPIRTANSILKPYDEKYSRMIDFQGNETPTSVVYCFASIGGSKCLSLRAFSSFIGNLTDYFISGLGKNNKVMFELEVQESDILNVKDAAKWVLDDGRIQYSDERSIRDEFKNEMLQSADTDEAYTSKFKEHVRKSDYSMEAVLPYIKKEWVVAYRTFRTVYEDTYEVYEVTTRVLRDAFPLWVYDVYVCEDSHLYKPFMYNSEQNVDYMSLSSNEQEEEFLHISMNGCPRYFTVYEALQCCNKATIDRVMIECNKRAIPEDMYESVTIMDLFPDGLLPIE